MINFQCLLCYFSKGDIIYYRNEYYVISDNFSFVHHYKYVKEVDKKEAKRTGTFPKLTDAKKKYKIPEFEKIASYDFATLELTMFKFEVNGKIYNFEGNSSEESDKLAKKLAKDLAIRYINDFKYRKYVDERLQELKKYDYAGRKKIDIKSINDWKIIKYLSTGMYGATYIVSKNGIKEYVMKTFHTKKGSRSPKAVEKECKITTLAGEIGVGPKVIECSSKDPQYIVMEKLDGPTVQEKYGTFSRYEMPATDLKKLEEKIKILDNNHIKHNDLHLGNVLYHKDKLYIIDYGMSNIVKSKVRNDIKNG